MHVQSWLVSLFMDCPPNFGITCPSYEEVEVSEPCTHIKIHESTLNLWTCASPYSCLSAACVHEHS